MALHLQGLAADKEMVPEPSTLETIMGDPENHAGVAVLVPARTNPKIVRVNITLSADVLERIDACAQARGLNRSNFLAQAAKHEMERP